MGIQSEEEHERAARAGMAQAQDLIRRARRAMSDPDGASLDLLRQAVRCATAGMAHLYQVRLGADDQWLVNQVQELARSEGLTPLAYMERVMAQPDPLWGSEPRQIRPAMVHALERLSHLDSDQKPC